MRLMFIEYVDNILIIILSQETSQEEYIKWKFIKPTAHNRPKLLFLTNIYNQNS